MASIRKEIAVDAPAGHVWDAIRDVGALHTRLARGMVRDTRVEGDSRLVTFANGDTVRERIVDIDDRSRRLAYGGGRLAHYAPQRLVRGRHERRFTLPRDLGRRSPAE